MVIGILEVDLLFLFRGFLEVIGYLGISIFRVLGEFSSG